MWLGSLRVCEWQVSELPAEQFVSCELQLDQSLSCYLCESSNLRVASRISLHIVSSPQMRRSKNNKGNAIYFITFNNNSWLNSRYISESNCEIYCDKWK